MGWGRVVVWLVMSIPAAVSLSRLAAGQVHAADLLHGSGEMSARLVIVALALTPLRLAFPNAGWLAWLRRYRRDVGVAAFGYAALHTALYLVDMQTLSNILAEIGAVGIWTGWLSVALFAPLAVTSNGYSVSRLGGTWYVLHRLAYPAALLTLLHWVTIHNNALAAWVHFTPLITLEVYRVFTIYRAKQQPAA